MKLSDIIALCEREWAAGDQGEVVALALTAASARDLASEVLASASGVTFITHGKPGAVVAGARAGHVLHPVTKRSIPISLSEEADMATVRSGTAGTRVVEFATADAA